MIMCLLYPRNTPPWLKFMDKETSYSKVDPAMFNIPDHCGAFHAHEISMDVNVNVCVSVGTVEVSQCMAKSPWHQLDMGKCPRRNTN
jgi:hypothetical protein